MIASKCLIRSRGSIVSTNTTTSNTLWNKIRFNVNNNGKCINTQKSTSNSYYNSYNNNYFSTSAPSPSNAANASIKLTSQTSKHAKKVTSNNTTSTTSTTTVSSTTVSSSTSSDSSVPIINCILAMMAGVGTVSLTAAIVEYATASSVPPFDPQSTRYDQSTFLGRCFNMILACDSKLLLYSEAETRKCKSMVLNHEELLSNLPPGMTQSEMNRSLWEAQRISSASLHPDTDSYIPQPFRMSGYVAFNGPICVAMVASTSTPALLFWSWVNQSQNALVNYYNRNAASEMSNETLMKSYTVAVTSALSVAFGLATVIQKRFDPVKAKQLMKFVAFPSAVVASSLNCYIVRSPEIQTGIPLLNSSGDNVLPGQTSSIAAEKGVNLTTMSRALLQAPVYFLPPVLIGVIPTFQRMIQRNPSISVPLTTYLLLVSFGLGLPASTALFPKIGEIPVHSVEEKFQGLRGKDGVPYDTLYYNKGL